MIGIRKTLSVLLALTLCLILIINSSNSAPVEEVGYDADGDVIMEDAFEDTSVPSEGSTESNDTGLDLNLGL